MIASRIGDVDYVDMRYSNGFAVGWKAFGPDNKLVFILNRRGGSGFPD